MSNYLTSNKSILLGTGNMGVEYTKILKSLNVKFTAIGRSKKGCNKFYEKTGVPALLNTSFNLHGEPIVRTVNDGLRVFKKSELEVLWLDNHIIEKNN